MKRAFNNCIVRAPLLAAAVLTALIAVFCLVTGLSAVSYRGERNENRSGTEHHGFFVALPFATTRYTVAGGVSEKSVMDAIRSVYAVVRCRTL